MAVIEKKAKQLKSAKQGNAYELIAYLDLFEGKISYTELVNMPIPILYDLVDAKKHYDEEKVKAAQKRADEVAKVRQKEEAKLQAKAKATAHKPIKKR